MKTIQENTVVKKNLRDITIEPEFRAIDNGNRPVGQKFRALLDYRVIEKTKSFTTLKITDINIVDSRRII